MAYRDLMGRFAQGIAAAFAFFYLGEFRDSLAPAVSAQGTVWGCCRAAVLGNFRD